MDKTNKIEAFVNAAEKGSLAKAALGQGVTPVYAGAAYRCARTTSWH